MSHVTAYVSAGSVNTQWLPGFWWGLSLRWRPSRLASALTLGSGAAGGGGGRVGSRPELGAAVRSTRTLPMVVISTRSSTISYRLICSCPGPSCPGASRRVPLPCPGHPHCPGSQTSFPSRAALGSSRPDAWAHGPQRRGSALLLKQGSGLVLRAMLLNVGVQASLSPVRRRQGWKLALTAPTFFFAPILKDLSVSIVCT